MSKQVLIALILLGLAVFVYFELAITYPDKFPNFWKSNQVSSEVPVELTLKVSDPDPKVGQSVIFTIQVIDKKTGKTTNNIEISHERIMHLVGVRQEDLDQFFHIHPEQQGTDYVVSNVLNDPGTYIMWAGIVYQGRHINYKLPAVTVNQPLAVSANPVFNRTQEINQNLKVEFKALQNFTANQPHTLAFAITDMQNNPVKVGQYLAENAHINIVSQDTSRYYHLHTNYGQVGVDHSVMVGHTMHMNMTVSPEEVREPGVDLKETDLLLQMNLPVGTYKIFFEFVTLDSPEPARAEFWLKAE